MRKRILLLVFQSIYAAAGTLFILYAWRAGLDDIISMRELLFLGTASVSAAVGMIFLSRHQSNKTLLLVFTAAILSAAAINFEFPELMKLPLQLPAENRVEISDIEEGAEISMTWAYWFRPRTQKGDPFLTNPDADISFSHLQKNGKWTLADNSEESMLVSSETGASIGISGKPRAVQAVLCFKVTGGDVLLNIPNQSGPFRISPDMTENQPYRVILRNGLIQETAGNVLQIIFWSGFILLWYLIGINAFKFLVQYTGIQRKIPIYCLAFLIPCIILIFLCLLLKITPFGDKTFLINDMWGQYGDYMAYLRSIIKGENDLFYSFSLSVGDEFTGLLAYYLMNPINWLVCLFPAEKLPLAITILVIVRYGICGLTAAVYFVKRRNCSYSALLFSTCYALMSYNVVNTENTCLREGAMILPLVILGIEQITEGGNIFFYLISLAASIVLNYYSGYQICIFAVIYFLYYMTAIRQSSDFRKIFMRFIGTSILAAAFCAFLLIPVMIQLRSGPKELDTSIFGFKQNMPWSALFGKMLISAYDVHEISSGYPNLYIGLTGILLIPSYFLNKKIFKQRKAATLFLFTICLLVLQINPLNLVLHGFSAPNWWPYRYSFIISFFMLIIAQEGFQQKDGWSSATFIADILLFSGLAYLLLYKKYGWMTDNSIKVNISIAAAVIIILFFGLSKKTPYSSALLGLLTIIELFLNCSHTLTINTAYERSNTTSAYADYYNTNLPVIHRINAEDNGFFRIEKTYWRTPNDPMLFGYNGISHYSSTLNNDILRFLSETGFRRNISNYRIIYAEGSDVAMDSLLGIKYLISGAAVNKPYAGVFAQNSHTVFQNPYALPIMFTASKDILDITSWDEKPGFELQNDIFSALTGENINIFTPAVWEKPLTDGLYTYQDGDDICYSNIDEDSSGTIRWNTTSKSTDTLYAFFPTDQVHPAALSLSSSSNKRSLGYYFDESSYHIIPLGSFLENDTVLLEMEPLGEQVCMKDAQFYHENLSELQKAISILRHDETYLQKITSSHLEGSFIASSEKSLFFTIPYSKGWRIKIDGQSIPASKVFNIFMAVPVSEGNHTIEMRFIPPGLIPGILISFISVITAGFIRRKETLSDRLR